MNQLVKITLTLLMLFSIAVNGLAQNLVPNFSFEDTTNCSIDNQIFRTPPWQEPTAGTSDWFNPCASSPSGSTVPSNDFGIQNSQEGASHAGFILFYDGLYYREYIQTQLLDSLVTGNKYWVSFHVSLSDSSEYAIKEIGAYFSDTAINSNDIIPLSVSPQIKSNGTFLSDKINWILISGNFIASGGEKFITLGNFQDSTTIDTLDVGGNGIGEWTSYYYIDNICISDDSTICDFSTEVNERINEENIRIYPNPACNYFNISTEDESTPINISIYNALGQQLLFKPNVNAKNMNIDISNYSNGLLFIKIEYQGNIFYHKLIKN